MILKKIHEDIEYLKKSMDQLRLILYKIDIIMNIIFILDRQKPLKMATTFVIEAFEKIEARLYHDAYILLQKAEFQAMEAETLSNSFEGHLKCVQLKLVSSTLIESAIEIDGKYFKYTPTKL